MIAEFQFETPLLRTAIRESSVNEVVIEELDASGTVPLRAVCWLDDGDTGTFEAALSADATVDGATQVAQTARGTQYDVTCSQEYPGTEIYYALVDARGVFVSGVCTNGHWEVCMRFPDREAVRAFRERIERADLSLESVHQRESDARAHQYGVSDPQHEILLLASEQGYFDVPRRASLADLADDLDVSSQAASERLRRGLDSLVERALLPSE